MVEFLNFSLNKNNVEHIIIINNDDNEIISI
jgi:hypothetical protein